MSSGVETSLAVYNERFLNAFDSAQGRLSLAMTDA
jgi:hypothetical protein